MDWCSTHLKKGQIFGSYPDASNTNYLSLVATTVEMILMQSGILEKYIQSLSKMITIKTFVNISSK